jgi:outer membrane protein TolC
VRSALLDVDATSKLVAVARSNVELATRALSDETDRVNAGVDDNLPLVTAQATWPRRESNLVESLYQYNLSKLALARAAGVIEQQYRVKDPNRLSGATHSCLSANLTQALSPVSTRIS